MERNKVKNVVEMLKLYPDIFPSGYLRYAYGSIKKEMENKTCLYIKDVGYLGYWRGKRNTFMWRLEKLVVVNRGRGDGSRLINRFFQIVGDNYTQITLKVRKSNKVGIRFYQHHGFVIIDEMRDLLEGLFVMQRKNITALSVKEVVDRRRISELKQLLTLTNMYGN